MNEDRCTVYAKPFPLSTTEAKVKELFSTYGSVNKVKLRRDTASGAFRGSVFITFRTPDAADKAVAKPPRIPGSDSKHLQVVLRSENSAHTPQAKRSGSAVRQEKRSSGASLPPASAISPTAAKRRRSSDSAALVTALPGAGAAATNLTSAPSNAGLLAQLRDRDLRIETLETQLEREERNSKDLLLRLEEAQHAAVEAGKAERNVRATLLKKESEVGCLKGEVASLRSVMHQKLESVHTSYKEKVHQLEVKVGQLKDALSDARGKPTKAAVTAAAPAANLTPTREDALDALSDF